MYNTALLYVELPSFVCAVALSLVDFHNFTESIRVCQFPFPTFWRIYECACANSVYQATVPTHTNYGRRPGDEATLGSALLPTESHCWLLGSTQPPIAMAPHVAASIAASSLFLAHAWQQLSPFSLMLLPCDVLPCRQCSSTISCTAEKRTKKRWLKNTDNKRPLLKYESMRLQRNSSTIRLRNYILENHLASNRHQIKQMANSSKLRKGRTRQ